MSDQLEPDRNAGEIVSLILLSGGMDSVLCLHRYGAKLAVGFDYGQPHLIELSYAKKAASFYSVQFDVVSIPAMPKVDDVVFAGRNAVMLSVAAGIAQSRGLHNVIIGCNFSDAQRFPDCRPEFIKAMNQALHSAYGVFVHAPLLTMTKAQIKSEAESINGFPKTWTCYSPVNDAPCGECYSCKGLQC